MTDHDPTHDPAQYDAYADAYAEGNDDKPTHALYERPAMLSLMPDVRGARVLDVGCGPGWYAAWLQAHGASVVAFDAAEQFVRMTRERTGGRATVLRADLAQPLDFAADGEFAAVVCPLVLHYVEDWHAVMREFARVLRPGGVLVFSTHHPTMDWRLFERPDYFAAELVEDEWDDVGRVTFYRRPLTDISAALADAGFVIERLLEPRLDDAFRRADPRAFERWSPKPWFLFVRARREPHAW